MPAGVFASVKVDGLREFRRGLKDLDKGLPKVLRLAFNDAVSIVVADAQPRVPRLSGRAAGTVKAASTQSAAKIKAGGTKAPYFPWLDFGGKRVGRGGGVAERPFKTVGRYIWHSFAKNRNQIVETTEQGLAEVARRAGLEVTTNGQ